MKNIILVLHVHFYLCFYLRVCSAIISQNVHLPTNVKFDSMPYEFTYRISKTDNKNHKTKFTNTFVYLLIRL